LPNRTGLPDRLKSGIEALSGLSMNDVRVHRNSPRPGKLGALAYARGSEIHLGPGQEQHLGHEAWHIVQQKQGRVRRTGMAAGGVPLNDEASLEAESDRMGARAATHMPVPLQRALASTSAPASAPAPASAGTVQLSRGSQQAKEELRKAMGKAGSRVLKQPNAKPHTKSGTGSSGTDHQARNAMVINKAKQDTRKALNDPTMFSASRMRSDDVGAVKDKAAESNRAEKAEMKARSVDDEIREVNGLGPHEKITSEHRKVYQDVQDATAGSI
jgi:hypothetical protein